MAFAQRLSMVVVLVLAAGRAHAQAESAPALAPAAQAQKTAVVVADAFEDETENAKLRAKIYDVCRERGYTPDGKADTKAAAEQSGAMHEGRVVADAGPLDGVRKAVGASVLVRVAKGDGGVRVLVVTDGDAKEKLVQTADAALAAVRELLVGKKSTAAPAAAPPAAAPRAEGISAGFILKRPKKDDEPDFGDPKALAQAWKDRGGLRVSYGAHAQATGLIIPNTPFASQNPETGDLDIGKATTYGVGLGVGLDLSVMYLPLPEPASGSTSWAAVRAGLRLDLSGLYVRPPLEYSYRTHNGQVTSRDPKYDNLAYLYGVLPFQLGVHFGFGDFRLPTLWRGVVLGVAYSPAMIFSLKVGEKEDATQSSFNYGGIELSADIAKIEAGAGSQPQIRVSALLLPRVKDDLPWLASAGVGAVWY
ncbi:MAG: hypothetical protein HYZ29_14835 [Myxococcales bacterium]|nr:hypothetical protein [Myxococcales bacterium]